MEMISSFCKWIALKTRFLKLLKTFSKKIIDINKQKQLESKRDLTLKESPLNSKNTSIQYISKNNEILYGYKFQFCGRFTRKQKAANL